MHDVAILAAKGLAGGLLVLAFALLSEGLQPKRFAGLFGAAPSVAIAGLAITLLDKGSRTAHQNGLGMIVGGVAMVPTRPPRSRCSAGSRPLRRRRSPYPCGLSRPPFSRSP